MTKIATLLTATALLYAGCGEKKPSTTEEKPAAANMAEPAKEPATPEPAKAEPAAYSEDAAKKLVAQLEQCDSDIGCEAYKPLVAWGAKVAPQLAAVAVDAAKPAKGRAVAAKALVEIKDPATGKAVIEAAKAEQDFMLRSALFEAAGASGNDEVLALAGAYLLTEKGWDARVEVNKAIVPFGKKAFDWASAQIAKVKPTVQSALADVIADTAQAGDLPALQALIGKIKDPMSQHRFARRAIELGDLAQFDVLVRGLTGKDEYDRSDAGNMLGEVIDKLPADKKDRVIEVVKAAKAKDQGGLTSAGYDTILKKLGA